MSKGERRRFYKRLDTKFDIVAEANELHSRAGPIIKRLGLAQAYELLAKAESLDEWLALCKVHLEGAGKRTTGKHSGYEWISQIHATISAICETYGLPEDNPKLRTVLAKCIIQLGVKRCSKYLREQKSFPDWLEQCKAFRRKLGSPVHKPRKNSNRKELHPLENMKHPKTEVVGDRKIEFARNWQRKNAKHQLADEDPEVLRRGTPKI